MAKAKAEAAPETTTAFECAVAFAFEDPDRGGVPRVVKHGEVVSSDDSAYRQAPMFFAPVGTPHIERPKVEDFVQRGEGFTPTPERKPDGWRP